MKLFSKYFQSSTYATIDNRLVTRHKRASDPQKANLLKCIRKFNENPKAGVQLLGQLGILDDTDPEQIAQFLIEGRLSKKKVGEYLGDRHDLNQEVLKCFIKNERHQCANIILVEALRQFLYSFRLPGEAQQVRQNKSQMGKISILNQSKATYPRQ